MAVTVWGCFALSSNDDILQRTYWAGGTGTNVTSDKDYTLYIGLRSMLYVSNCGMVHMYEEMSPICHREVVHWDSHTCSNGPMKLACDSCKEVVGSLWFTAFSACASLILSLLGAQTRIRSSGDVPIQKMLGMFAEANGVLTLTFAILMFENKCFWHLRQALQVTDGGSSFWLGPGFYCYIVCIISGLVRAVIHWLTPLPGRGKGLLYICGFSRSSLSDKDKLTEYGYNENIPKPTSETKSAKRTEKYSKNFNLVLDEVESPLGIL